MPAKIYTVDIKKDKCKGCGLCIHVCPKKHLVWSENLNKRGVKFAVTDENTECVGCGFCFLMCPDACIEIYEKENG